MSEFKYSCVWLLSNVSSPLEISSSNKQDGSDYKKKQVEIGKIYANEIYFREVGYYYYLKYTFVFKIIKKILLSI